MSICICPVCKKVYDTNPIICDCGYDNVQFYNSSVEYFQKELFHIYKYTKNVFNHKIDFEKEKLDIEKRDHYILIRDIVGKKGVAIIEPDDKGHYVVESGIMALNRNVISLIINAEGVQRDIFDESIVKMVFFGERFKELSDGYLMTKGIRYLYVDSHNPNFVSVDNVMFDKDMKHLVCYPSGKIEEEYRVPRSVKYIDSDAFYNPCYLKRLHVPKGIYINDDLKDIEIIYEN